MPKIRIGTRSSKLALWQAEWVAAQLHQHGVETELIHVSTRGDTSTQSLAEVGGQGLFTKEIQLAVLEDRADVAVHSLKDLPTVPVEGLRLAAVPERETTLDCLISRNGERFEQLKPAARIGTGSSRRGAQLLTWRPDVVIHDIRGNVDTRLRKLDDGDFDAIVLAAAGLKRLGLHERVSEELPQSRMLPAIGQGALGLECRAEDNLALKTLNALNHGPTFAAVTAERQLLNCLLAGCLAPVAGLAMPSEKELCLRARVLARDGSQCIEGELSGSLEDAAQLGQQLADELASRGARELIEAERQ